MRRPRGVGEAQGSGVVLGVERHECEPSIASFRAGARSIRLLWVTGNAYPQECDPVLPKKASSSPDLTSVISSSREAGSDALPWRHRPSTCTAILRLPLPSFPLVLYLFAFLFLSIPVHSHPPHPLAIIPVNMAFAVAAPLTATGRGGRAACLARPSAFTSPPPASAGARRGASTLPRRATVATPPTAAMERTFIAVKPDGVQRGLVGAIIGRFEAKGYKLLALKALVPSKELASEHYEALSSKPFYAGLVDFICSGPVVAMVWGGGDVVKAGRTMIGETSPTASAPGSIRGDYGVEVGRNVVHGSDAVETAEREIKLWFGDEGVMEWESSLNKWVYED